MGLLRRQHKIFRGGEQEGTKGQPLNTGCDTDMAKLLGLFEHIHINHITTASFADSKTLVTASSDCTVSIWAVTALAKVVDLQPKKTLFGHRTPITTLAISRSYSSLLSASSDGKVILWDLNRGDLVRVLTNGSSVEVRSTLPSILNRP